MPCATNTAFGEIRTPLQPPASYHAVIISRIPYLAAGSHAEILGRELELKTALDPSTSHHPYLPTYANHAWHYSIELIRARDEVPPLGIDWVRQPELRRLEGSVLER